MNHYAQFSDWLNTITPYRFTMLNMKATEEMSNNQYGFFYRNGKYFLCVKEKGVLGEMVITPDNPHYSSVHRSTLTHIYTFKKSHIRRELLLQYFNEKKTT